MLEKKERLLKYKNWKKEIARDCIALGSIPFYLIVIIRAIIGKYMPFVYQLLIALIVLIILSQIKKLKDFDPYVARCFVLFIFTSIFYKDILYIIFAFILWVFVVISSYYLKVKKRTIVMGILFGIVSSVVGYYLSSLTI